jgi:hypothetical protein
MALDPELVKLMTSTITVYPFSSINTYGESSYSNSGTQYAARLQGRRRLVRTETNREIISILDVFVNATTISEQDKVVLPITTPSGTPFIMLGVTTEYDENGAAYQVIHFGDALSHRNLG